MLPVEHLETDGEWPVVHAVDGLDQLKLHSVVQRIRVLLSGEEHARLALAAAAGTSSTLLGSPEGGDDKALWHWRQEGAAVGVVEQRACHIVLLTRVQERGARIEEEGFCRIASLRWHRSCAQ